MIHILTYQLKHCYIFFLFTQKKILVCDYINTFNRKKEITYKDLYKQ